MLASDEVDSSAASPARITRFSTSATTSLTTSSTRCSARRSGPSGFARLGVFPPAALLFGAAIFSPGLPFESWAAILSLGPPWRGVILVDQEAVADARHG